MTKIKPCQIEQTAAGTVILQDKTGKLENVAAGVSLTVPTLCSETTQVCNVTQELQGTGKGLGP